MTTDPRVIEAARGLAPEAWGNPEGPYHYDESKLPTGVALARMKAIDASRKIIMSFLAQEPTDKMVLVGCDNTLSHPSFLRATFKMMNAQAAKEIAE